MIGLNGTLSLASEALSAESGALSVTNNNIANVNTPGYSREVADLSSEALESAGTWTGNGVTFSGATSVRDQVLQLGIQQKTADAGSLNLQSGLWSGIQDAFSSTTSGVGASLSSFFAAVSALSTNPSDTAARQAALAAGSNVVNAFHQAATALSDAQQQANSGITSTVAQVNELSSQIASLNGQLTAMQAAGQDGGSVEDQRDALTTQLAGLIGITSTATATTPSLSTANGSPLVVGSKAFALTASQDATGSTQVLNAAGDNITSEITGGSLGGSLTMRDASIPGVSAQLDQLADEFAQAMNSAQAMGYDANGNTGQAMFTVPVGGSDAATAITLALSDPSQLATSSTGNPGDAGNVQTLLAVQNDHLTSGQTPTAMYASLVETIGESGADTSSSLTATNTALTQLTNQQASESGVSIDEETTNLLRYQQAYSAAAKVVTTVNDMYSVLMNMDVVTS